MCRGTYIRFFDVCRRAEARARSRRRRKKSRLPPIFDLTGSPRLCAAPPSHAMVCGAFRRTRHLATMRLFDFCDYTSEILKKMPRSVSDTAVVPWRRDLVGVPYIREFTVYKVGYLYKKKWKKGDFQSLPCIRGGPVFVAFMRVPLFRSVRMGRRSPPGFTGPFTRGLLVARDAL